MIAAHRILAPGGLMCAVSLTEGTGLISHAVARTWRRVHASRPTLVGGCRPIVLEALVRERAFRVVHREVIRAWGVPSEVLVAAKVDASQSHAPSI
jgi:hypothetical protein